MRANSLAKWHSLHSEKSVTARSEMSLTAKARRQSTGVVKLLTPPPDEKTIRRLNKLAAQYPFCVLHRVKKHDTL